MPEIAFIVRSMTASSCCQGRRLSIKPSIGTDAANPHEVIAMLWANGQRAGDAPSVLLDAGRVARAAHNLMEGVAHERQIGRQPLRGVVPTGEELRRDA